MEQQATQAEKRQGISKIKYIIAFILELNWFLSASAGLVVFLLVKKYCFDVVRVNSRDMEDTLGYGDAVLLKKFSNQYHTGDMIYFEYPIKDSINRRTMVIQRVFGLPGDSLWVFDKSVFINGMKLSDTVTVKHNYFVRARGVKLDSAFKERYNLKEGGEISDEFDYSYSLTFQDHWRLKKDPAIASVERKVEKKGSFDESCFPYSPHYKWNMDYYGGIYVPKMNDTLTLDTVNFELYSVIIRMHEKNHAELRGDSIFINKRYSRNYVVKKNYYFVLGDNRDNANDSRSWGFLPENFIGGKVVGMVRRYK